MTRDGDGYTLSTGKKFYANNSLLSVGDDGIYEGYDGIVELDDYYDEFSDRKRFTLEEAREVAEYAKAMWDAWLARRTK